MGENILFALLDACPKNDIIVNNLVIAYSKINSPIYKKIMCSISGGSDSDIMMDICFKCDVDKKIDYVWFDTGLEYEATKEHLNYLENRYGVEIKRVKAIKPIPVSCKTYGQPFLSKTVSLYLGALQRHGFKWENESYEDLIIKYPKAKSYIGWWCNKKQRTNDTRFCIARNKYLKEFIMANPPTFPISSNCCNYAKKDLSKKLIKENKYDLSIIGVRKAEGGVRATNYKTCFDNNQDCDNYRPLFWYFNETKNVYEKHYGIIHSKCYTKYGFKRTGCACCPFGGKNVFDELEQIKQFEPNLYKAVNNIFGESFEYTKNYYEFCEKIIKKEESSCRK